MEIVNIRWEDLEFENIGHWPILIRVLIIIIAFVLTIYFGYRLDLNEKMDTLNSIKSKIVEGKKLFSDIRQEIGNLEAYKNQVIYVEEQLNKLIEQIPYDNEEAIILEDISEQAASFGLQFVSIKPGVQEDREFYTASPIEMELMGNYNGFGDFFSMIEIGQLSYPFICP